MSTRILVSLECPDMELDVSEAMPDWKGEQPPTAEDVVEAMKGSVNIYRLMSEWGLDGPHKVSVQVVCDTDKAGRFTHTYATWEEVQEAFSGVS